MNAGPSKEQLESLFKTSRKYFDEMAKEYYTKDRDFYNKNFAPFYSNPLLAAKRSGRSSNIAVAAVILLVIMGITAAAVFFLVQKESVKQPVRNTEDYQAPAKKETEKSATSVSDSVEKHRIKLENLERELRSKEKDSESKEYETKENTGKREVKSKPVERTR